MTHQHHRDAGRAAPFALGIELLDMPRSTAPSVSAASIREMLQTGRGELAPEERGLLLALLEEHAPESRGAA